MWNVERIRPAGLEPFDFTRENITCCLWLAEGFTQYYGPLLLRRAGLVPQLSLSPISVVMNSPARAVRSPVEMSEHGPFADAGVANDIHDRSRTFISYYTDGAALAFGLDLMIRERTAGRLSLDDFMRRLWERFGAVPASAPGLVARPYTLADLRGELADLVGDRTFADAVFDRHIEGREVIDYGRLLGLAGYVVRRVAPDRASMGPVPIQEDARGLLIGGDRFRSASALVPFGTPAYAAGLDRGDLVVSIDGQAATMAAWQAVLRRRPGEVVRLTIERRDGTRAAVTLTLAADPTIQVVAAETIGPLSDAARSFRDAWLRTRVP